MSRAQSRPCESKDPYAAAFVLRDAVWRLRATIKACGYGSLLSQGRQDDNEKTPRFPKAFSSSVDQRLRTALRRSFIGRAVDHLRSLGAGGNRNAAGLLGLGNLANEIDVEQAVLERGAFH